MPELPEVETLRRDLARTLVGRTFITATARIPKLFVEPLPPEVLVGHTILALSRRAKFLIWESLPKKETAEKMKADLGVESVEFSPCELLGDEEIQAGSDYLKVMRRNIENITKIFQPAK